MMKTDENLETFPTLTAVWFLQNIETVQNEETVSAIGFEQGQFAVLRKSIKILPEFFSLQRKSALKLGPKVSDIQHDDFCIQQCSEYRKYYILLK